MSLQFLVKALSITKKCTSLKTTLKYIMDHKSKVNYIFMNN